MKKKDYEIFEIAVRSKHSSNTFIIDDFDDEIYFAAVPKGYVRLKVEIGVVHIDRLHNKQRTHYFYHYFITKAHKDIQRCMQKIVERLEECDTYDELKWYMFVREQYDNKRCISYFNKTLQ